MEREVENSKMVNRRVRNGADMNWASSGGSNRRLEGDGVDLV